MKEILLIKTDSGQKIKTLLDREQVNYQIVYDDVLVDKDLTAEEEEIYRRDMRLANKDKDRQKEVKL